MKTMVNSIEKIYETLDSIEKTLNLKDPAGKLWDLRITTVYGIFRAFDKPRFRLTPADPDAVLQELKSIVTHIENSPERSEGSANGQVTTDELSPQAKSRRMQILYGLAWAQLTHDQYYDAADLLARRIINSNLSLDFIKGAECLDMATGIARYALAMVQLGAKHVVGIDFSQECLEEARRRLKGSVESQQIEVKFGDIYNLPKTMEEAFDFVVANGVIHHLPDPKGGLASAARCTRKGGTAFTFVFAKDDTPWWPSIKLMRRLAAPVPIEEAHRILSFYEVPGTKMFNTLDYSYTPIQHQFEKEEFEEILRSVGFSELQYLEGGVIHDSVLRTKLFETDRRLFGISEIRYLMKK